MVSSQNKLDAVVQQIARPQERSNRRKRAERPLSGLTRQIASEKHHPANDFATVHAVVFGISVCRPPKQPPAADRAAYVTGGSRPLAAR